MYNLPAPVGRWVPAMLATPPTSSTETLGHVEVGAGLVSNHDDQLPRLCAPGYYRTPSSSVRHQISPLCEAPWCVQPPAQLEPSSTPHASSPSLPLSLRHPASALGLPRALNLPVRFSSTAPRDITALQGRQSPCLALQVRARPQTKPLPFPAGFRSLRVRASRRRLRACVPARPGTFVSAEGGHSIASCVECPAGSKCVKPAAQPTLCPEQFHQESPGQSECKRCGTGKVRRPGQHAQSTAAQRARYALTKDV